MSPTEPAPSVEEPERPPTPDLHRLDEPAPAWAQPEIAWAIAILAGFAGSWAGMLIGVPGAAELAATAAFAPVHLSLRRRRGAAVTAFLSLGWALGFAGAVLGAVLDDQGEMVRTAFPLGRLYANRALDPWLAGTEPPTPGLLWPSLGWILAATLAARASRGVLGLLGVAVALGAVAGGTADWALAAVQAGAGPILSSVVCAPPLAVVALGGTLLAVSAAAVGRTDASPREVSAGRGLVAAGWALACLAVLAEPWVAPHWGRVVLRLLPI